MSFKALDYRFARSAGRLFGVQRPLRFCSACGLSFGYGRLGSVIFSSMHMPQRMQRPAEFIKGTSD